MAQEHSATTVPDRRALTSEECTLIQWLLEHGEREAPSFLPQLADATVVSRCSCGCASIDLAIDGRVGTPGPMNILSDYRYSDSDGHLFGAFVFAYDDLLAGLDLWSIDGQATAGTLPKPEQLTPLEINET